ncbi:MAG: hypothetical protein V4472_19160 [Pseudomonadota bacterium]
MAGWLVCVEGGEEPGVGYYAVWEPREAKARRRIRTALCLADAVEVEFVRRMSVDELLGAGAQPGRIARLRAPC